MNGINGKTPAMAAWRSEGLVHRIEGDAIVVLEVFDKKTSKTPKDVIDNCRRCLRMYEEARS